MKKYITFLLMTLIFVILFFVGLFLLGNEMGWFKIIPEKNPSVPHSKSLEEEFVVKKVKLGTEEQLDLDGDGFDESIYYGLDDFKINGQSWKQVADNLYGNNPMREEYLITDINISDKQKEIAILTEGLQGNPQMNFFVWNGTELYNIGNMPAYITDYDYAFDGRGTIRGIIKLNVLQFWYAPSLWKLTESNQIEGLPQELYYPLQYNEHIVLTVPLPIYQTKGDETPALILSPQPVKITATDNKNWCFIQGENSERGWFKVDNFSNLTDLNMDSQDVFDNMTME